jgi:chromosome segregation ATPase
MQTAPVFVKIDEYREILNMIDVLRDKVSKAQGLLDDINSLKSEEDRELSTWSSELEEIQRKIEGLSKSLFEPSI